MKQAAAGGGVTITTAAGAEEGVAMITTAGGVEEGVAMITTVAAEAVAMAAVRGGGAFVLLVCRAACILFSCPTRCASLIRLPFLSLTPLLPLPQATTVGMLGTISVVAVPAAAAMEEVRVGCCRALRVSGVAGSPPSVQTWATNECSHSLLRLMMPLPAGYGGSSGGGYGGSGEEVGVAALFRFHVRASGHAPDEVDPL